MDAKNLLTNSLENRWKNYRAERKKCREEFSEEAVHDLRVAARRMLAALDILRAITPHKRIQKLRRDLKDQIDALDNLRDTQVLLADISEFIQEQPALKFFRESLRGKEKKQLRKAQKYIKSIKLGHSAGRWEKIPAMLEELPADNLRLQLLQIMDDRYADALERHRVVNSSQPSTIHSLRLAFKKFRYTLEVAHPLLENFPKLMLESLHEYQTRMGDIQDLEVALQRLEETNASSPDLELVRAFYQGRHAEAVSSFMDGKDGLFTFWRAAPNQNFPWENQV